MRVLLARLEGERRNIQRAREIVAATNFPSGPVGSRHRHYELARIELAEAVRLAEEGDPGHAAAARRALAEIDQIPEPDFDTTRVARHAQAILSGDTREQFLAYLHLMAEFPDAARTLEDAIQLMPEDLDREETLALREWMRERATWLRLQHEVD